MARLWARPTRNEAPQSVPDIDLATAHRRARQAWVALVRRHAPQLLQTGSAPSPMTWQQADARDATSDIIRAGEPRHRRERASRPRATPLNPSEHRPRRASDSREAPFATPRRGSPASLEFDSVPSRSEPLPGWVAERESAAGCGEKARRWGAGEPVASPFEAQDPTVPEPIRTAGGTVSPAMSEAGETRRLHIGAKWSIPPTPRLRQPHVAQSDSPSKPLAWNALRGDQESERAPPRCSEPAEAPARAERQTRWRAAPARMPAFLDAKSPEDPSSPWGGAVFPQRAPGPRPAPAEEPLSQRPYDPWPCLLAEPAGDAGSPLSEQEIDGDRQRRLHNEQRGL